MPSLNFVIVLAVAQLTFPATAFHAVNKNIITPPLGRRPNGSSRHRRRQPYYSRAIDHELLRHSLILQQMSSSNDGETTIQEEEDQAEKKVANEKPPPTRPTPIMMRRSRDVTAEQQQQPTVKKTTRHWITRTVYHFLMFLWRGMTLPFPILRVTLLRAAAILFQRDKTSGLATAPTSSLSSSTGFSLRECLLAMAAYLALGGVAYTHVFESWSLIDALYFSVASFSTVGYGDLVPTNVRSRIFTCVFGLTGVACLGVAIATLGTYIVQLELEALERAEEASRQQVLSIFDEEQNGEEADKIPKERFQQAEKESASNKSATLVFFSRWRRRFVRLTTTLLPSLSVLVVGATILGRLERWPWWKSLYGSIITACTVGYGDVSPITQKGRLFCIFFVPLAVAAAGEGLSQVATLLLKRRHDEYQKQLLQRELDWDYLLEMDINENGIVSRLEYLQFMLKEMGMVDQELLDQLNQQFDRLDVTQNGTLSIDDLEYMAKLKGVKLKRSSTSFF